MSTRQEIKKKACEELLGIVEGFKSKDRSKSVSHLRKGTNDEPGRGI